VPGGAGSAPEPRPADASRWPFSGGPAACHSARAQHLLVVDRARDGQDDATGPVGRAPVVDDAAMRRATHRADRPGDLAPERVRP
jgi:hypothetical protein